MRVVAEKQLPFALKVPNPQTLEAMAQADTIANSHRARFPSAADMISDIEKSSVK